MRDSIESPQAGEAARSGTAGKPRKKYARPKVFYLGNMVDVTLKSGNEADAARPHQGRPF